MDKKLKKGSNKISFEQIAFARLIFLACLFVILSSLGACSLSEEIKRIDASRQYEERQEASRSTNLTGEQIFIRSCYTCHSGTRDTVGPSLVGISEKYPDDADLKAMIRKGKGMMPSQPATVINDEEMDRLVTYIKDLKK